MNTTFSRSLRSHILSVGVLSLVLVGGIGGWASTTSLSNAVVSEGTVIIDDNVKKIQHLTGGVVTDLLVKEGTHVQAGDVLLRLDSTSVRSNLGIIDSTLAQLYARRSRLEAERIDAETFSEKDISANPFGIKPQASLVQSEIQIFNTRRSALAGMKRQLEERKAQLGDEMAGNKLQIESITGSMALVDEEYAGVSQLYKQQRVTMQRVNELKRQKVELEGQKGERMAALAQAEGKIAEIELQSLQLNEDRRTEISKDLGDIEVKVAELEERHLAAVNELNRLEVRAPASGRIYQLMVHTIGGVAAAGEPLMLLAPDSRELTVEAKISTRNIDQVGIGKDVDIRFSAFDQRTTPEVTGKIVSVAPDTVTDQRTGVSYYPVRVKPTAESLAKLKDLALYPGMPAEIFIKVADRSVISYLTKPLTDQMKHTFREE